MRSASADAAVQVALSAAHAAWAGAMATTLASVVALGVALFSARQEDRRRRQEVRDREIAFCFSMVGAVEMLKPLIVDLLAEPQGEVERRRYASVVGHAVTIAEAGLGLSVFDLQLLRDAYSLRGLLNALRALPERVAGEAIPHAVLAEVILDRLDDVLEADDRFFARLPPLSELRGVHGRTPLDRSGPAGAAR